ncbi:hypothetical protein H9Y04_19365 [Streptomyces sp. TRM66268-LWL]|uniref:Translation initiation factor IF-2 n=1 Tax=Streptomyces polyasparticus TaxID=2767826 RepID=A0ABR7SGU7_9ACTN|nr:hypothetical protein [Streptomyces polyasparticus]MBC9714720.1 hypothetical protein [Streptomyces polyasparticus]
MPHRQLAPGVELVAVPGRGLAVRTPDGEFLRVETGGADPGALLARLGGAAAGDVSDAPDSPGVPDASDAPDLTGVPDASDAEIDRIVEAFADAGYTVEPSPSDAVWHPGRRDILLLGDPVLTDPLARHLHLAGARPRPGRPEHLKDLDGQRPAAVVWCATGPAPARLWEAGDRLPERGIAWLRCHREGGQAYVEPLAARPGDVTSSHVRARRLAVTPAHRELAAYWNGPRTPAEPAPLTAPQAGLLAALLADDLTRWGTGGPDFGGLPARRRLRRVDLRTLTVTEHPVLPVPDVTPMPEAAG